MTFGGNFRQNTGLNFCKTLGFWTFFYGKNHCAQLEKRDKKPDITRPTFIHEGTYQSYLLKLFLYAQA